MTHTNTVRQRLPIDIFFITIVRARHNHGLNPLSPFHKHNASLTMRAIVKNAGTASPM